jgi:hypothetical protein
MNQRLFFLFLILAPSILAQQLLPTEASKVAAGQLAVDWAVPESPAFTVLGLTPQTVTRPSSAQQLATALLNGVDEKGNFQTGVALDFQPYMLLYGYKVDYGDYRRSRAIRFLSRAQTSIGSTKGASEDDKSARFALGLRLTLLDKGDPYRDEKTANCLANAGKQAIDSVGAGSVPGPAASLALQKEFKDRMMEAYAPHEQKCRDQQNADYRRSGWNNSSWIIGGAPSWISSTGSTSNLKWNGAGAWTSYAYGFEGIPGLEDLSQLILHYRYRNKEQVADPNNENKVLMQDSQVFGARLRLGNANGTGSFEYVFLRQGVRGTPWDNSSRLSAAFERRVSGNIWLNVTFGTERGRVDGRNKAFALTSFNWSFNQKPQ